MFSWSTRPARRVLDARRLGLAVVVALCSADSCTNCSVPSIDLSGVTAATLSFTNPPPTVLSPGQSGVLDITVTRQNTYNGDVPVVMATLVTPDGATWLTGDSILVPAGQTLVHVMFHVLANAFVTNNNTGHVFSTVSGFATAILPWDFEVLAASSFAVSADQNNFSIVPGASVTTTARLGRAQFAGAVTFGSATAPGITIAFSPASTSGDTTVATISVAASAATGQTVLSVPVTGIGAPTDTLLFAITVTNATFTMTAAPPVLTIVAGGGDVETATLQIPAALPSSSMVITGTAAGGITITPAAFQLNDQTSQAVGIQVVVAASVTPGNYTVTLHANSPGELEKLATFQLQVLPVQTGSYALNVTTAPLTVAAGSNSNDIVNVVRTNFTDVVTIAASAPAGFTVTPNPATANGAQVTLNIAAASTVAPGTYNVSLTGTSPLHPSVLASFAVVVAAQAQANTTWSFCPSVGLPLWVATQDGSGPWTQVTGASNAYPFAISSAKGGIAYVLLNGSTTELHIFYGSMTELQTQGNALCGGQTGTTKSIGGVVVNAGTAASARIALGSASTSVPSSPATFQLTSVPPGPLDLIASTFDAGSPPNALQMLVQRSLNLATGGNVGTLDFSAVGFAPDKSILTVNNSLGQTVVTTYNLHTANNPLSLYYSTIVNGTSIPLFGVPVARQVSGDLHYVVGQALSGSTDVRFAATAFATVAGKQLTFGSPLNLPTVSTVLPATTTYARLRAIVTTQAEYSNLFDVGYQQSTSNHLVDIQTTAAYANGAATLTVDIPDFSATAGWNNSWGPTSGLLTSWLVTASGWSPPGGIVSMPFAEGATLTSASKQGSITP